MNILDQELMNEINSFFDVPELDEYLDKSPEVQHIHSEMKKLADKYYETKSARSGDFAGAVLGMRDDLVKRKAALIAAIGRAKTSESEKIMWDEQQANETKSLKLAEDANVIANKSNDLAKDSQAISKRSNVIALVSAAVSVISIGVAIWSHVDDKNMIRDEVAKALRGSVKEELRKELSEAQESQLKLISEPFKSDITRIDARLDGFQSEVTNLKQKLETKPKSKAPKK